MKRSLLMIFAAAALVGASCERHEFDGPNGTKQLHEHNGSAAHAASGDHAPAPSDANKETSKPAEPAH